MVPRKAPWTGITTQLGLRCCPPTRRGCGLNAAGCGIPRHGWTQGARAITLRAIQDTCVFRGWVLHAAHVRGNHVHVVVEAGEEPSELLQKLKGRISRALNDKFGKRRWWARHGSTVPLWDPHRVDDAVAYTWDQGVPMARYLNPNRWREYVSGDI